MIYLIKWTTTSKQSINSENVKNLEDAKIHMEWLEKLRKKDCKEGEDIKAELIGRR